jgi:death-on-curing protein
MSFDHIRVADILAIHTDQIARYGGAHGVRDSGLLEAALFRPQAGYHESLVDEAATLWEILSQNHPFIDGNKRTAFAATFVFLAINGLEITASDEDAQTFILGLYDTGGVTFENLQSWLSKNTRRA